MVKKRKLLKKVLGGSKNIRFDDFVQLIEGFGFALKGIKGSHHIYRHPDLPQLLNIQPKDGKAKTYQIKQFLQMVQDYGLSWVEEDDDNGTDETEADEEA